MKSCSLLVKAPRAIRVSRSAPGRRSVRGLSAEAVHAGPVVELTWSYLGAAFRLTEWPEVKLERRVGEGWVEAVASEEVLGSAMLELSAADWRRYLDFVPAAERTFVERFRYGRLAAVLIAARCPEVVADLNETPALVPFLAAHASLRGTGVPRWEEIAAVHGRGGVFALLEWLGLPASRETLGILKNLVDADVPRRLLEPLRALLWRPAEAFVLRRTPELTDRELARLCNALAA